MQLKKLAKACKPFILVIAIMLLSIVAFSQDPGDNPDGPPPAVPFSDYMHIVLIIAGAIMALFAIKRLQRQQA